MSDAFTGLPDAEMLRKVPALALAFEASPLYGGITNRNYRIQTPTGIVVARVSDPGSSSLRIDRAQEYANSVAAAQSGAGAPVIDYLPGQGVLVVGWIEGRTLTPADVGMEKNLPRIAQACRVLHRGPRFVCDFNMFDIQSGYLALVLERGFRLPERYLEFMPQVERMRTVMQLRPEPTVPCNNDLLAANFIDEGDQIRIIDYEYSGNNEVSFELGNIWSESTLPDHLLEILVREYWQDLGEHAVAAKIARARIWGLMSKYGWTLWASIQDSISPMDFDYWSWGMEKYDRAVAEFDSPELDRLMTTVASED